MILSNEEYEYELGGAKIFIDENLCATLEDDVPNGEWITLMCNDGDGVEGKNIRI